MRGIDWGALPAPCYVVDERLLIKNLELLADVRRRAGCRVLLALKGFSMFSLFPLIGKYLDGVTASSLNEARLGREEMGGEVHVYAPAYVEREFSTLMSICDHIVFNSFAQWDAYKAKVTASPRNVSCGIRVNPEYSEVATAAYNPCGEHSRLGVRAINFRPDDLDGLEGLHFHTLCEQGADALAHTVNALEEKFGRYISRMKWMNLGGGHHITRADYDVNLLVSLILRLRDKYGVEIYLEPGEAVALNTGFLVSTVLDIVDGPLPVAILDASAACHMPDVLEMPYRPEVIGAGKPGEHACNYRLAGNTCLAGDIVGDYSFPTPLKPGDRVVFCDMAHYTMVKNNTFNGVNLPSIAIWNDDGARVVRQFGYEDFKGRLS